MFSLPTLMYLISSGITFILIYLHLPIVAFQQIAAILLLVILILLALSRSKFNIGKINYPLGLFFGSFFVQILILATGGIYSSLLILIHLFTLGSSFLINIPSSILFLLLTLSILIADIYINPQILAIFKNDPGTAILYFMSFIVVIPLAQYIVYRYHFKDAIFKILEEYAETGEQRETSILNNISELVVVTDRNLKILSTNEALEQSLNLIRDDCVGRPMLEIVPLQDQNHNKLSPDDLSVSQILLDKATRIVSGFFYKAPNESKPRSIAIQVRPVLDSQGQVNQIVFLISNPQKNKGLQRHSDLQEVITKQRLKVEELRNILFKSGMKNDAFKLELIHKTETDLLLAYDLEDHPIIPDLTLEDIAVVAMQAVASKQELASYLEVNLQFILPKEEITEISNLSLIKSGISPQALPVSSFMMPLDKKWFVIILQKLLDIGLFLVSEKPNQSLELSIRHNIQYESLIDLFINIPYQPISDQELGKLFEEYYPDLIIKSNLNLGSGLEGFIAKNIIDQLNLPFNFKFDRVKSALLFSFTFAKTLSAGNT